MLLYHYTTMDTFYSMIEHSLYPKGDDVVPTHLIMWAGYYSYQNDSTECELYFKGLKKAIQAYSKNTSRNLMEEYNKCVSDPKKIWEYILYHFQNKKMT